MKEDIRLPNFEKGIGSIITKTLSKHLSIEEIKLDL